MKIYCNVYVDERYIIDAQSIKMKREWSNSDDITRKRNNYKYYIVAKDILNNEYNIYIKNTKTNKEEEDILKIMNSLNEEFMKNHDILDLRELIENIIK